MDQHKVASHEPPSGSAVFANSVTVSPLYNNTHYNSKILYNHFDLYRKVFLFIVCFLCISKFSITSKYLRTICVVVKWVHCIFIFVPYVFMFYVCICLH